ncbi:MAG: hypothetical protein OXG11_14230 [Chloroflexi bacterium]|nr:hypothetical protein [Chloroflexota bacterium]
MPYAIVGEEFTVDRIAKRALMVFARWKNSPATNPKRADGSKMPRGDELKLTPEDIRTYLSQGGRHHGTGNLATALLAEGSLDNQGVAKPSDFYFTAGQQKFLDTARKILGAAERGEIVTSVEGPWRYESTIPSLGWDVTDDRVYALRANNPSPEKKLTNPGTEALALLGLSLYPVFAGSGRTQTQGCSGSWKNGWYSWPLWGRPATSLAVRSLLAHAYHHPALLNRHLWYRSWGISTILRSPIRRTDQGGYGTFGPAEVTWNESR